MEIKIADIDGVKVFRPIGNINRTTANELEEAITSTIQPGSRVVVDLTETASVSSAGLRVLFIVTKKVEKNEHFVLAGPNSLVADILNVTGFSALLNIRDTVEAAVNQAKA